MANNVDFLINNTGLDIRGIVETEAFAAAREDRALSEHLSDMFTLTIVEVDGEKRARLDLVVEGSGARDSARAGFSGY